MNWLKANILKLFFLKSKAKAEVSKASEDSLENIEQIEHIENIEQIEQIEETVSLEESVVDRWWILRNKPSSINHYELISSGINMDMFSGLEANVGKFKFTRQYFSGDWQIEKT